MVAAERTSTADSEPLKPIKPAVSSHSGLLLQEPLDLSWFKVDEFNAISSSVGSNKIHKSWTQAVASLPPHSRSSVRGLTSQEVMDYMMMVRQRFEEGTATPISDIGLVSTHEDVIRKPMFNHIAAFSNETVRVYLLVQKTYTDKGWGYYSIVQDLTTDPPWDYFAEIKAGKVKFEGATCYKCHSSGPLAIHPARADLVYDPMLAAAISKHIAKQPRSRFRFPEGETVPDYGKPLALEFCSKCHDEDGVRAPLYKVHAYPIRVYVDFGYMPPKHPLTPGQITELKAWLDTK